jgi:membrane associated rhomboid family serine protease
LIPYSDPSEPNRIFPYINIGLILVNFAVFFYELSVGATGQNALNNLINQYGLVPCEYTQHCSTHEYAGTPNPFFFTLLSSMFLHAGWVHILGNMVFLWVFGDNIENSMGHLRYLIFYLLCGLAANALEIATGVDSAIPGLGASGAIAGVLGAYFVLYPKSRVGTLLTLGFFFIPVRLPAFFLIGFWFVLQLFSGLVALAPTASHAAGGVAYWAHVGGFAAGVTLIWLFRHPQRVHQMQDYHSAPYARW